MTPLPADHLPPGIRARIIPGVNGLAMHVLEAGDPAHPCLLLLHGFPELAYSWRKVMPGLAAAGYCVVAPDQRGYGRTTGWDGRYDTDLRPFAMLNLVRDQLGLLDALGREKVAAVIGHDFGSPVAGWCALLRPDVFPAVAMMSSPWTGAPARNAPKGPDVHAALAALPRPRRHYQWYYSDRGANEEMWHCPQGVHAFMRAYYHMKSADWPGNKPFLLGGWNAESLAQLPTYYVMDLGKGMAETVAPELPATPNAWLPDNEMAVYAAEYARNGFQGGLNWYRCRTTGVMQSELEVFAGKPITVPSAFISGAQDWGIHQVPGAMARMRGTACTDMRVFALVEGAGHWVQQEQPQAVLDHLLKFFASL